MAYLHKDDMLRFLKEINSRLMNMNKTGEIFIIGGAAISLAFGGRDATEDMASDSCFGYDEMHILSNYRDAFSRLEV